jgi:transcriptional regulator with XRE-family HTH domain
MGSRENRSSANETRSRNPNSSGDKSPALSKSSAVRNEHNANLWLGFQIRSLRLAKALSLQDLGNKAELSIGMLSQVERGLVSPSVRSLRQISAALEVPPAFFFEKSDPPPSEEIGRIVRGQSRRILRLTTTGVCKELLTPDTSGLLQLTLIKMQPRGSSGKEPYVHRGEDAGFVLSGAMRLWVGADTHLLNAGDSFRFKSSLPHRFMNASKGVTEVLWAVTPPFY